MRHFNALAGVVPCEYPDNFTSPETRMIFSPDAEDRTIVSSFVWTKHRNVLTDGRTDRQTDLPWILQQWILTRQADAL